MKSIIGWGVLGVFAAFVAYMLNAPAELTPLVLAAVVQSTYLTRMPEAYAGMPATMHGWDGDSRGVENSNGIPFGRACGQGVNARGCVLGSTAAANFIGVSVRDITLAPVAADSDYIDEYPQYANASLMTRGDIWVEVGAAVTVGGDVTYNNLTGVLSSAAAGGTQFAISGARWMTAQATVGGLAILRLSGHLPSA